MTVNGQPKNQQTFSRVCGYVEQVNYATMFCSGFVYRVRTLPQASDLLSLAAPHSFACLRCYV